MSGWDNQVISHFYQAWLGKLVNVQIHPCVHEIEDTREVLTLWIKMNWLRCDSDLWNSSHYLHRVRWGVSAAAQKYFFWTNYPQPQWMCAVFHKQHAILHGWLQHSLIQADNISHLDKEQKQIPVIPLIPPPCTPASGTGSVHLLFESM